MGFYFASVDLDAKEPELTFYRVSVDASAFLVESKFQTGYYDAEALHQLFGQVRAQKAGEPAQDSSPTGIVQLRLNPGTEAWEVVSAKDRFTILYGANADALAEQLRLFAESQSTGNEIASLIAAIAGGEAFVEAQNAEERSVAWKGKGKTLAQKLKSAVVELEKPNQTDQASKVRSLLLGLAQEAAITVGSTEKFDQNPDKGFQQAEALYQSLTK